MTDKTPADLLELPLSSIVDGYVLKSCGCLYLTVRDPNTRLAHTIAVPVKMSHCYHSGYRQGVKDSKR